MRGLLQSGPSPSASPAQKSLFAVNYGGSFDIRGTVLYIGKSLDVTRQSQHAEFADQALLLH